MLLEVNCSVKHFQNFLNQARDAGIEPDFDIHGADETSGFGIRADDRFFPKLEDLDENGVYCNCKSGSKCYIEKN